MRRISICLFFLLSICLLNTVRVQAEDKLTARALSHYILGGIYERLDNLDKAVGQYKAAIRIDPRSPQLHLSLAVALIKNNNFQEAIPELNKAVKLASDAGIPEAESISIEAHTILALIYSLQGNLEQAAGEYESALRSALSFDPQNIRIHKSLGRLYLQQHKLGKAQKTYMLILKLEPSDYEAHFYLGNIYAEQSQIDMAIKQFKSALEFNSEYPDALNSLGYLYAEESMNLDEAELMIQKALEYEPNNGAYIDSLGWVYYKQGRYKLAVVEFEKAVQILADPVIYEHLGDVYFKLGNIMKAKESWQKALEIEYREDSKLKEKLEQIKIE